MWKRATKVTLFDKDCFKTPYIAVWGLMCTILVYIVAIPYIQCWVVTRYKSNALL